MAFRLGESGSVTLKAVVIGAIVLLLLVPLGMLRGLVSERAALREQGGFRVVQTKVGAAGAGSQLCRWR